MTIVNVRSLRVKELKAELQKRGLNKNGVKETLVNRLQSAINDNIHQASNDKRNQETNTEQADLYDLFNLVLSSVNELADRLIHLEAKFDSADLVKEKIDLNEIVGTISRVNPARYDKRPGNVYTVPTKNRFDVLADNHVTDAEPASSMSTSDQMKEYRDGHRQRRLSELHESVLEGTDVEPPTPMSTSDQMKEYRDGHRQRRLLEVPAAVFEGTDAKPSTSMSTSDQTNEFRQGHRQRRLSELHDVVIEGDSMIKHIEGRLLSRKHRVVCHPNPGATVADISPKKATEGVKAKGDVILHVGSNDLSKGNGITSTADDIVALADVIAAKGCDVCLSGVIHRRWESVHQRRSVDGVNGRLRRAARERRWGFVDNDNIGDRHLGRDGVHINKAGQAVLASNLRHFIERPQGPPTPTQQTSYAEVVGSSTQDFEMIAPRGRLKSAPALPMFPLTKAQQGWNEHLRLVMATCS